MVQLRGERVYVEKEYASTNAHRSVYGADFRHRAACQLWAKRPVPVAPTKAQVEAVVREAYEKFKNDTGGKNADYIPYLAQVDSKLFGIAIVTTDNQVLTMGDIKYSFSIQSISKVFSQALAMEELGAQKVFEKVGNEPTGRAFNSVFAVADMPTHTGNPYVNAGAISTVSLISGQDRG